MDLSIIITQTGAGLTRAAIFFMLASGLTLAFGVTKIINFAHGSLYLLSAYIFYSLSVQLPHASPVNFWLNLILAPIIVAAIGAGIEIFLLRRVYKEEHLMQLLLTFGLVYIISDSFKIIWGVTPKSVSVPDLLKGAILIGGGIVPSFNAFIVAFALCIGGSLWFILYKTRFGIISRASSSDPETARSLGVSVNNVYTGIFALGTFLAGLAGTLNLPLSSARLGLDTEMTILAFVIVIIGGVGSVAGAAVAALLVGLIEAFGIMYTPRFAIVLIYIIMIVMLIVRPYGVFGKEVR